MVFFFCLHVQTLAAVSPSSISVSVVPENPAPGEEVRIDLSSYGANLDSVSISWSVNGSNLLTGTGKKSFSLKAPSADSESRVMATIIFPDGKVEKRIIIKPSTMIMLWQATDSFVPPFYRGKALPTADSQVKVVAMPEIRSGGTTISSKNMTYAWKINYSNEQGSSGYGKNYLLYSSDYLDSSSNIGVTVTTVDQKYSASGNTNIQVINPKIVFYKRDVKLGTVFEKAIPENYRIEGDELLEAVPYFISPKNPLHPFLVWNWSINDASVFLPRVSRNLIPLKAEEGLSGIAKLRLEIENTEKIFQTGKEIKIEF